MHILIILLFIYFFYFSDFYCTTAPPPQNLLFSHKVVQLTQIRYSSHFNHLIYYYYQLPWKYYEQNTIIVILYINSFNYIMYLSHRGKLPYCNELPSYIFLGQPFQCILRISNCLCIAINHLPVVSTFTYFELIYS